MASGVADTFDGSARMWGKNYTIRAYHPDCGQITFEDYVEEGQEVEVSRRINRRMGVEVCKVVLADSGSFILEPLTPDEHQLRATRILSQLPCPHAPICKTCPAACEDDVCLPAERRRAEGLT